MRQSTDSVCVCVCVKAQRCARPGPAALYLLYLLCWFTCVITAETTAGKAQTCAPSPYIIHICIDNELGALLASLLALLVLLQQTSTDVLALALRCTSCPAEMNEVCI